MVQLSPVTWIFLFASFATVVWTLWIRVRAALAWLGLIASPGDDELEPLFKNTEKVTKAKRAKKVAKAKKITKVTHEKKGKGKMGSTDPDGSTGSAAEESKPSKEAGVPRPSSGVSLKALKKQQSSGSKSAAIRHHSSPLYVGTLVHGDDVTGCACSNTTIVTTCRDRELRRFKVPGSSKQGQMLNAYDARLVQKGVLDVCDMGGAIVYLTRGAGGEPAIESRVGKNLETVSSTCERIFAPKSKFEPRKLVGAGSTVVAASSDPRVAVFTVAQDGTLSPTSPPGTSYDTSSIVNHDITMSPDGSGRFAVATFSADVPIFVVERSKLKKIAACSGAKKKVMSVAWSPCSRYIAASSEDMMLRVFDVRGSKTNYTATTTAGVPSSGPLSSLVWVGDRVVGAAGRDVFVFDGETLEVLHAIYDAHPSDSIRLAAIPNSKFFLSWSSSSCRLWNATP